ncbi:MAG: acetate--CoA ligase family protein, partial [Candidatus Binatia bacterium]
MTNKKKVRAMIDAALTTGRRALTAPEAKQLCDLYGIPVPKEGLAKTAEEAARIASRLRFPVVMKIISEDILHKTEAGGVIVGLESAAEVKRAFAKIVKSAKAYKKAAKIEGVQIQQLLKGGHEVMVGA